MLGGWVPSVADPEVKLLLRVHSFRHAGHAELWDGLSEGRPGVLDSQAGVLFDALEAATDTAGRVAGAYGVVLPALVAVYEDEWERANTASDAPLLRALGLMLADDREALRDAGEFLSPGVDTEVVRAAAGGLKYTDRVGEGTES